MIKRLCAAAHLLTRDEAPRIAANIAKLPGRRSGGLASLQQRWPSWSHA
jgi:hypothetical protein